ncbi:Lsr2 family DNA-binding protein [Fodinicola feengrottensis]|uniref:Lsr2 DNA-binding domain-containing protein n=1 Tax=Fodinicola feengrottensis TaxID=435914 RepID=A0ABN2FS27_9ACTN|nr:Lsr2 family protein [Fodinicola feengrottensis]
MRVNLDVADAVIDIGDKGVQLSLSDNSGSVVGHVRIGHSGVEWRKGASRVGRAKKIPLRQFITALEKAMDGGPVAASRKVTPPAAKKAAKKAAPAAAKKAAKKASKAKAAPAVAKRGPGRPRKKVAAPARKAAKRPGRRAAIDTQTVRAWAQGQGMQVAGRGRLSSSIIDAYRQAN